jgi:hypothetical protein
MNGNLKNRIPAGRQIYGRMARISRPKLDGFGSHEGVLLPDGQVVHLTQDGGVQFVSLDQFAQGHPVEVRYELAAHLHQVALSRLHQLISQRGSYDLILNNCEIFARQAVLRKPESPQVLFWTVVSAFGLLALAQRNR